MTKYIAVINAGSSSVKFALYDAEKDQRCQFRGQVEGIGVAPRLKVDGAKGRIAEERDFAAPGFDHAAATREIIATGRVLLKGGSVAAFGHRVVHGGLKYDAPVRVTEAVLDDLVKLEPLAPLHQPHNLAPIRAIMKAAPEIPQIACFDTAFHRTQSNLAQAFGLPRRFAEEAFAATVFMAFRMTFSFRVSGSSRRTLRTSGSSSLTLATARAYARSRTAAASPRPWDSPPSTAS
jgi:acetate kinase